MPFKKGRSGNPKGKPRGAVNHATREIRDVTRQLFDDAYFANVRVRLSEGTLPAAVECRLLAYAYGEPKQSIELDANLKAVTKVVHEHRQ